MGNKKNAVHVIWYFSPKKLAENETGIVTSCSAIFTSRCISTNVLWLSDVCT